MNLGPFDADSTDEARRLLADEEKRELEEWDKAFWKARDELCYSCMPPAYAKMVADERRVVQKTDEWISPVGLPGPRNCVKCGRLRAVLPEEETR